MFPGSRLRQLNTPSSAVFALLAFAAAAFAGIFLGSGPASAADQGGMAIESPAGSDAANSGDAARFGNRVLREGMSGPDVKILKGIVRSKALLKRSPLTESFDRPTTSAVRSFQSQANMARSGVVNRATSKKLVRSLHRTGASWYGPGLWGNHTACGNILRPGTMGVAHKTLPCGSKVLIGYHGRYVMTKVIDRGPYIRGRSWDLTLAVSDALKFTPVGAGDVRSAVVTRGR